MSYPLEPREELLRPSYWGDIDIEDPEYISDRRDPAPSFSRREIRLARAVLANCLTDVALGDYTETANFQTPIFDPKPEQRPDGSVIIIEKEGLTKIIDRTGTKEEWDLPSAPETPPIVSPLAEYWRQNLNNPGIGSEIAVFPKRGVIYGRSLEWGVLLTRDSGNRVLVKWTFGSPRLHQTGVKVEDPILTPFGYSLPLELGKSVTSELVLENVAYRGLDRIKDLRIIHPASSNPERNPNLRARLEAFREFAGKHILPVPAHL